MTATNTLDLVKACQNAIDRGIQVCLVVPGPPPCNTVRLVPGRKKCPRGEIVNWQDNPPRTVAYFDPIEVVAYLAALGLVRVVETPAGCQCNIEDGDSVLDCPVHGDTP